MTLNPVLRTDHYPLPTAEDLFERLGQGQKFTKLDLGQAYLQVRLDLESRKLVTINTLGEGLYQYTRLPFGISSAPAVLQLLMEKILQGIPGMNMYLDDLLITGKDDNEHFGNLQEVLERLKSHGLRLKRLKCQFLQDKVDYLGFQVSAEGIQTTPDKITAVRDVPRPTNSKELRLFLGLVNYYGKFVEQLSTIASPLNELLKLRTAWKWTKECEAAFRKWTKECEAAFRKLKERLTSTDVLMQYSVSQPVKLACNESAVGVGAVLQHVLPDGSESPSPMHQGL